MKILAFDSSSPVVSIAMINDDPFSKKEIILYHQDQSQPRTTSSIFFEELEKVIQKHGRPDRIVVGLGPGSYNGLRSSIATAQGMASSCGAELIGIPSIVAFEEGKKGCWVVGNARGGHYWLAQIIDHQCVRGPELFTLEELERGQSRSLLISGLEPKVNEPKLTNCGTDPKTNGLAPNMTNYRTDPFPVLSSTPLPELSFSEKVITKTPNALLLARLSKDLIATREPLEPLYLKPPHITMSKAKRSSPFSVLGSQLLLIFFLLLFMSQAHGMSNEITLKNPKPTWETQKKAQTFQFSIPAPRGQITDRHGEPLAQNRLSFNLALQFPTPLNFNDKKILEFAKQYIAFAQGKLQHPITISDQAILNHYHRRGLLPLDLLEDLSPKELAAARSGLPACLILRQTYTRLYPEGELAAHVIGYTGRKAPLSVRGIENKDLLFPQSEGREGIEQVFDAQLQGEQGILASTYDEEGKKSSERIAQQPVPGNNVITTLDKNLQLLCEKVLRENAKQGAIVMIDPNTGEIVALASYPEFNPNDFVPLLNQQVFEKLSKDPAVPLLPRAFRSAYPPGSSFKPVVGIAALQDNFITPEDRFSCPPSFDVGNVTFHNWKKVNAGKLNFVQAFTQSCNTWFYQCGLKMKAQPIISWAHRLGLGNRTGIPLKGEAKGNIPDDQYMLRVQHRKILPGDIANMSIGQGDILVTPLQMAQMMGIIAAQGKFHQTRLIQQIQTPDNKVLLAYPDRVRDDLQLRPEVITTLRQAMIDVTEDAQGTAHRAQVPGIHIAGKTGTGQWGPKNNQRTVAWFAGYAPADKPQYAFAALYEGDPNDNSVHGGTQAAGMIHKVLAELYPPAKNSSEVETKNTSPEPSSKKEDDDESD
ncbi:MAG: penicillin-binding protein 2 [Chthoniobacterales bacterium]|nr:penicillin-binding protein 2 [Chthoniobacterales bacterium]